MGSGQLVSAVAIVATTTCAPPNRSDEMVGTYALVSVNDRPLPVKIFEKADAYQEIVGGTLTLTDQARVQLITESRIRLAGGVTQQLDSVAGTYTYVGGILRVTLGNSPVIELTQARDVLTLDFANVPGLPVRVEHVFAWQRIRS